MNRRDAITACAGVAIGLSSATVLADIPPQKDKSELRAVWKWIESGKEWIRVRMDTLKIGDTMSMEVEVGSKERYVGKVESNPKYENGECGLTITGYTVTVE